MSDKKTSPIDLALAHRHFAVDCFNHTWTFFDKTDRTSADDEAMILCAMASLWHWTQRADCKTLNLSIGHWQISRAYAFARQGENAMMHARRSLELAEGEAPFYVGYSHEAIARAAAVLGDDAGASSHLQQAKDFAAKVTEDTDRTVLEDDLRALVQR